MGKYDNDVKRLLELVGGKGNIQAVSHCMTRMMYDKDEIRPHRSEESR